jgi:hypothetical protein
MFGARPRGANTLFLSGSATPVPDIVALATSGDPGIVDIPRATGAGVFAVATVNGGIASAINVTVNTNRVPLPVTVVICETNPATGVCLAPQTDRVATVIAANATATFGIFVTGTGNVERGLRPGHESHLRPFHGRERPSRGDQRGGADAVKSRKLCC